MLRGRPSAGVGEEHERTSKTQEHHNFIMCELYLALAFETHDCSDFDKTQPNLMYRRRRKTCSARCAGTHAASVQCTVEQKPLPRSKLKPRQCPGSSIVAIFARWQTSESCARHSVRGRIKRAHTPFFYTMCRPCRVGGRLQQTYP